MTIKEWKNSNNIIPKMDLTGYTRLCDECDSYDIKKSNEVYAPGSFMDYCQKEGVRIWNEVCNDPSLHNYTHDSSAFWDDMHYGWRETKRVSDEMLENVWVENPGYMTDTLVGKILAGEPGTGLLPYMISLVCAKKIAQIIRKPFNVSISGEFSVTKTLSVDVPYTARTGLFKKEIKYKREMRQETYKENRTIRFDGWQLESFRRDGSGLFKWIYCLGSDGNLYVVTTYTSSKNEFHYKVNELAPIFQNRAKFPNDKTLLAVMHGWMGALDAVDFSHKGGYTEDYYYDFPFDVDEKSQPYHDGAGTLARLSVLAGFPASAGTDIAHE
jgi:hypothetical protein